MAEKIITRHADSNGRDALMLRLANINHRGCELRNEIIREKFAYEVDPDNRAENFTNLLKACRRVLYLLYQEYDDYYEDFEHCLYDNPDPVLDMVFDNLDDVRTLIWECWLNDLKERGERHSMLREAIRVVQALPAVEIIENHLNENVICPLCLSHRFETADDPCHFPCNKGHVFHRECFEGACKEIADIIDQACDLRSEIIREKDAYEEDADNRVDNFAFQLNIFQKVLKSLQDNFYFYGNVTGKCTCENPSPECQGHRDLLERVNVIFVVLIDLILECWSGDMIERVERQMEGEIIQVVECLPAIKITESHIIEKMCAICWYDFDAAEEACHLPCNEGHIFHRKCIERWLKRNNQCPTCRTPSYRPKLYFYPAVIRTLQEWRANFD